jgi:hypothetical protein
MPQETMEALIGKTLLDEKFRNALLADPDRALAPYDLTEPEKATLKKIDGETMDSCAHLINNILSPRQAKF